jgi:hypothetical protein
VIEARRCVVKQRQIKNIFAAAQRLSQRDSGKKSA